MYDLFYFDSTGGELVEELLTASGNIDTIKNVYVNPNTDQQWHESKNKKIVLFYDLEKQIKLSIKNKNWFFKYYNEETFFNHLLARSCKSLTDNEKLVIVSSKRELNELKDKNLKKTLLTQYHGHIKDILIKRDFDLLYQHFFDRFGIVYKNKKIFRGYVNSVDLKTADVVIDLQTLIDTGGKSLFDQLGLRYQENYKQIVDTWKDKNIS